MRVLFVLTYYRPHVSGLTIYVEHLARALAARGHQVTVLTSHYQRNLAYEEMLDGVRVVRVPVAFRSDFQAQQRLYYTLEAMGLVEKLHAKVFQAIHVERKRLEKPEAMADWVAAQGVDKAKFMENFNSFSVASKTTRATQLTAAYNVEGVPAMGVAGRFYTDGTTQGKDAVKAGQKVTVTYKQMATKIEAKK